MGSFCSSPQPNGNNQEGFIPVPFSSSNRVMHRNDSNTNTNPNLSPNRITYNIGNNTDDLPPIRFINLKDLKKLTSFPRYPETCEMCIKECDIDRSTSLFIFVSHCWLRGWSGAVGWDGKPHPDNANHDKFQLILTAIERYLVKQAPGMKEVYAWIDYGCINQNVDPAGELKQLDKIVQSCDLVLTVIADTYENEWKSWDLVPTSQGFLYDYKAKAWNDGSLSYLNRCWCRVEMMYAANVPLSEDTIQRSQHFTAGLLQAVKSNRRPHYLYGTKEKMRNIAPIALPPLRNTFFVDYNPLTGSISKESDREKIKELIESLQPYISANQATVGYVGERNSAGLIHGRGTNTFSNGDVYTGEWKDNNMDGYGTYNYSSGELYVGEWKKGMMNGQGCYTYANGEIYTGGYKDHKRHGHGTLSYAHGDLYVGEYSNNMRNGHGEYKYASGNIYVGEYKDDKMAGHGKFTYVAGDVYVGEYKDDKKNGHGKFVFSNGDIYIGDFQDDKRSGYGNYKYGLGDEYIGLYKNDMRNGSGTFKFKNGDVYVGEHQNDIRHGQGVYTFANGTIQSGIFKDNEFTS